MSGKVIGHTLKVLLGQITHKGVFMSPELQPVSPGVGAVTSGLFCPGHAPDDAICSRRIPAPGCIVRDIVPAPFKVIRLDQNASSFGSS
jgi:hypothetical protein